LAVPINSVTTRDKSDTAKAVAGKKKDAAPAADAAGGSDESKGSSDDLDEVVFVLQADGTVKRVKVRTDIQDMNYIEVLSGVKAGDQVITGPYTIVSKMLREGMKVKVVPKGELFETKK
jgi:HlyD family secretion protein